MPDTDRPGLRRRRATSPTAFTDISVLTLGAAMAVLVGDGPSAWPVLRAAVAICSTVAVIALRRSHAGRGADVTVAALGLVGIIAGVGIGLPHAVRVGASAPSVAGIVALAAGLVLTGTAAATYVRGRRGWRKLIVLPIAAGATVLVVAPLSLSVAVANVPPLPLGTDLPSDHGMRFVDVTLEASDGVELAAWYVPSSNGAAVVLLGGATNTRTDELDHAAVLARHGYGVLLLDARGHGESDGDAMLWGWHGDTDIRAAVDYLAARRDVSAGRIGAVGMSMGAEEAIGAAGSDPRIMGVVAEGATARGTRDEGAAVSGIGGLLVGYFDWTTRHAVDVMTSANPPTTLRDAVASAAPRPFLIIAGGTQPAEIDAARAFHDAAPGTVDVWIAAGAGHTTAYDEDPDTWSNRVIGFLDDALDASRPAGSVSDLEPASAGT